MLVHVHELVCRSCTGIWKLPLGLIGKWVWTSRARTRTRTRTRFRVAEGTRVTAGGSFGLECRQPRSMDDLGPLGYGYGNGHGNGLIERVLVG